jgi:O-antigen/teichoic acid export membrane protein
MNVLVVGLMKGWSDVGLYSASHRMVAAVLTFGLIFQQVAFPSLARSWRASAAAGRQALNGLVRLLALGFVPIAVGTTVLAGPLVAWLLGESYAGAAPLLALEIWRAPLLSLAFLYQTSLIALNREALGVRLLLGGALGSIPLTVVLLALFGLLGAAVASIVTGLVLAAVGYARLCCEGRQPAWHHELGRPLLSALLMAGPCLLLARVHVVAAVLGGAFVYIVVAFALGPLKIRHLKTALRKA